MGELVTDIPGQFLDDLATDAVAAISGLEARLASLSAHVEHARAELDNARAKAQREREELDIEYSLEVGSSYVVEAPGAEELRRDERDLIERAMRASRLHRHLTEFATLIGTTQRMFNSEGEMIGQDAATQAAIRSAAAMAQETERQRLAREIHDGPAQALANAIIALEFVERAIRSGGESTQNRALEEVERIKSTLREGLTEVRRFIFDLRPTMLQDRGLTATVEHYIATYQSLFPMPIDFSYDLDLPRLSNDQELAAFRIIQESIQNARKHARASRTSVKVRMSDLRLVITIADDGRGFSPERVSAHMMGGAGLRGMRERSALVGGDIRIESEPGEGTLIEFTIPLRPSEITEIGPADDRLPNGDRSTERTTEADTVQHDSV